MKNRLVIIGLDGGTFKIIDPLIQEGKLPNLKKLIKTGTRAILKSTIPPLTPPAWISFMTGVNPGKHGFFDFRKLDKITYDSPHFLRARDTYFLLHSDYYAGNTLWDILGKAGYKVSVIMMPMTYPAWEINGYMISGFPSPDFKKPNTYPPEWGTEIGPIFDMTQMTVKNEDGVIAECKRLIKKEGDILLDQLKQAECDVYAVVFSSTDFAQHYLWKYLADNFNHYSSAIPEMYIEIDKTIGKIVELVEDESSIVVLSDHGFAPSPKKHFHTNAWLREEGYLSVEDKGVSHRATDLLLNPLRQKFALRQLLKRYFPYLPKIIQKKVSDRYYMTNRFEWAKTKAFRYRLGQVQGIVINLKGRNASCGIVEEKEYEVLRDEIIDKLKMVSNPETGERIAKEVYKREEIYSGKFLEVVPDIVFVLDSDFRGGLGIDGNIITSIPEEFTELFSGHHDSDGILILKGPKIRQGLSIEPVELVDLLPTILFDLELPIPKYADGRVIRESFEEPFSSLPVNYTDAELIEKDVKSDISEKDREEMKKALKGLGYLE